MITDEFVRDDVVVLTRRSRWRGWLVEAVLSVGAAVAAVVFGGLCSGLTAADDPADVFTFVVYATALYWVAGLLLSIRLTRVARPVPLLLRFGAEAARWRARKALHALHVPESDAAESCWRRAMELAVRRWANRMVSSGLALAWSLGAIGPLLALGGTDAFGRNAWMTGVCLVVTLLLFVLGVGSGYRRGETTATKAWAAVEEFALLDEETVMDAGFVARRRHACVHALAAALFADLVAFRLSETPVAVRRAAGAKGSVLAQLEGELGTPGAVWAPQVVTPLLTNWLTGRWNALPVVESATVPPKRSSLPRLGLLLLGVLAVLAEGHLGG